MSHFDRQIEKFFFIVVELKNLVEELNLLVVTHFSRNNIPSSQTIRVRRRGSIGVFATRIARKVHVERGIIVIIVVRVDNGGLRVFGQAEIVQLEEGTLRVDHEFVAIGEYKASIRIATVVEQQADELQLGLYDQIIIVFDELQVGHVVFVGERRLEHFVGVIVVAVAMVMRAFKF